MKKAKFSGLVMFFTTLSSLIVVFVTSQMNQSEYEDIKNIFIGVMGSSLIAFVGCIFEYFNEKGKQKRNIERLFKNIYYKYYKNVDMEDLSSIRNLYIEDSWFASLNECINDYIVVYSSKDIYLKALYIMQKTQDFYTAMQHVYITLNQIDRYIEPFKQKPRENVTKTVLEYLEGVRQEVVDVYNKEKDKFVDIKKDQEQTVRLIKSKFNLMDDELDIEYLKQQESAIE